QLIDAISDKHLWAEHYDRGMKDIFALQDEITMKILTALQVNLTAGEQARVWAKGTKNLKAIRLEPFAPGNYYGNLGMAYFQKGGECEEAVKACEEGLKRAPDSMIVNFMAVTVFSACGREKEARKTAKELLRINPKFSAESFAAKLPYKDPKEKEPVVEALRKAGL
ncbi:MAG: hypothetical protein PHP88_08560, partial [bacterium]|nr:hypothetical protein [bacterium]